MRAHPAKRGGRIVRSVAASAVVLAVVLATVVAPSAPVAATPVRPDQEAGAGDSAILDLVSCLQGSHRLAVVFLIDESQSLQLTDPDARRVDAAQAALATLTGLTKGAADERTKVDVSFAAFSNRYRQVRGWTALRAGTQAGLLRSLATFSELDKGTDTDFVNALSGARNALAARSAAVTADGAAAPCKAVLFFTDGEYDVAVRTAADLARLGRTKPYAPGVVLTSEAAVTKAEAAGIKALCEAGGLADGLRRDDITLLTIALAQELSAGSQDLLNAVTTGASGQTTCGAPVTSPPGSYLAADDVDLLIARFDEVAARVAGGTLVAPQGALELCGEESCEAGQRTVNLDASIRRLRIFALAPRAGMVVRVEGPAGKLDVESAGKQTIGSVAVTAAKVAGRGFAVELERPADVEPWLGTWKITLLDPSGEQAGDPAMLQLYLFSELTIRPTGSPSFIRGDSAEISASLDAPEGIDVDDLVASGSATMRLEDSVTGETQAIKLVGPAVGPYTGSFTPPADFRSSAYLVSFELRATTKDGATIVARSAATPAAVSRPAGAIQMAPVALALPTLTGAGSASADLVLVGGNADGCVWFGAGKGVFPEDAGGLEVTYDGRAAVSEGSCIKVPAHDTVVVAVEVEPERRATGAVRGVIEVHEKTDGLTASVTDVPYSLDLAVGINQARRLMFAVLLLLGGLGLPLVLLLLINAVTARFQSLDAVKGAVIPVRVQGEQLFRMDGGRSTAFKLRTGDFSSLRDTGHARRFTFGGIDFRARASRNPFGSTVAMAAPEGGGERLKGGAGRRVELDPSLSGSWIFLLDPDRTRRAGKMAAEGNLIAFVAEGDPDPQFRRLMPDLAGRLPKTAAELAGLVRSKRARAKAKRAKAADHATPPGDAPGQATAEQLPTSGPVDDAAGAGAGTLEAP
ncbi:MAG: hypothetical protein JWM47_63 [Acidimicrobiales bacterium]|nr:hypothetical protein [Acidimicrobiales bacterium]